MRSYDQLCAVARALDVVGDRWTLLIVRELLIRSTARFTDLQKGLPGIATNLLSQRLRDLNAHGIVRTDPAPPPSSGTVYRLTERGAALHGVVRELLKWGAATVPDAPEDAAFQAHWLSLPARHLLHDSAPDAREVIVRFGDIRDGFDAITDGGSVRIEPPDPEAHVEANVTGPGPALVRLVQGAVPASAARAEGVRITGDIRAVERILPAT